MQAIITIADHEFVAEYSYRITSPGYPATGPSWSGPGEPGAPMEFEVELDGLAISADHNRLPVPAWLKDKIEQTLANSDEVYDAIRADSA